MSATMLLFFVLLVTIATLPYCFSAATRLTFSAPVNPVPEGGMLALHCQIWDFNFQDEHEVLISRVRDGKTKRLSWNEEIVGDQDTVFLAIRQLSDTSVVYFMSITDVVKDDAGDYECKVIDSSTLNVIAVGSVNVKVNFYPTESNPECSIINDSTTLQSGEYLALNCSTRDGVPPVDVTWTRYGTNGKLKSNTHRDSGGAYGVSKFKVTYAHNQAVFWCTITSREFPGLEERCHVGPITVIKAPGEIDLLPTHKPTNIFGHLPTTEIDRPNSGSKPGVTSTDCEQVCSSIDGPVRFWIIATVIGASLAILFCFIGVCLTCKIRNESKTIARNAKYIRPSARTAMDDMYESLDRRCVDAKVYMAIEKLEKNGNQIVYPSELEEVHYNTAPRAPKF